MSLLKIKVSTELNDLENIFSGGLDLTKTIKSDGALMEFYTDFISGTASVTVFKLQELNLNDAKAGRINVISETAITTANLKNNIRDGFYQLYYEGSASSLTNKLVRYFFTDNSNDYISEPFYVL